MSRIVVLGGTGVFGSAAVEMLREHAEVLTAARGEGADLRIDASDPASLRAALRPGDVVVDTAGPFQHRTPALAEAAIEVGADVVDIADALGYVESVLALSARAEAAGVRLLPATSTSSSLSSALLSWSGMQRPTRMTVFLLPSTRRTAVAGTAGSLLATVGERIRVLRDGKVVDEVGFGDRCRWGGPLPGDGGRFEVPDPLLLPPAHPTLRTVEWYVDPNIFGLRPILTLAAHLPPLRDLVRASLAYSLPLARRLGSNRGGMVAEIEDESGRKVRLTLTSSHDAYKVALVPATMAALRLHRGEIRAAGVIPVHERLDPAALLDELNRRGYRLSKEELAPGRT
jgi:hypothetical protein